jgi:hypothetical protein
MAAIDFLEEGDGLDVLDAQREVDQALGVVERSPGCG